MKYVAAGLASLVVALVVAMLIVPAVVDWNRYRPEIVSQASQALGRVVEIRGDIGLKLLPAPVVTIKDAHIANVEGASEPDMISLASLEVKVAWAPLLAGTVRVEAVKLVRPIFNIEIFEDGRSNLTFKPAAQVSAPSPSSGAPPRLPVTGLSGASANNGGFDVSVENFVVEKGTLAIHNMSRGIAERVDNLNGRFAFASLIGPMEASASAVVHGVPLSVDVSTGSIIQGRTVPVSLDVAIIPGTVKVQFSGSINSLDDSPRLKGKIAAEGDNFRDFGAALGLGAMPDMLARSFGVQANLALAADSLALGDLTLKLDTSQAIGHLSADFTNAPMIDGSLAISRLDLDSLLAPLPPAKTGTAVVAKSASPAVALDLPSETRVRPPRSDGRFWLESLPKDLSANFVTTIEAITWRSEVIRQAKLDLALVNREITVSQLSALLPGSSDVALFGFVTEKDGLPQFDGTVDATTNDLRGIVDWLGVPTQGIAGDRLRKLSLNAKVSARPDLATVSALRAHVDATQIDGALTASLKSRLSLGANLVVDRVNLDAYRRVAPTNGASESPAPVSGPSTSQPVSPKPSEPVGAAPSFAFLGGLDANVRLRVGSVTTHGLPLNDVRIEAAWANGALDVKSASIGDLVGVTASLSGSLIGLNPVAPSIVADPKLKDVVFSASGKNLANLFRMAEIQSPVSAENLGAVEMTSRLNGSVQALGLTGELKAMGGKAVIDGQVNTGGLLPSVNANVSLVHPDFARFIRGFGVDYRPRSAKGGINIKGRIVGGLFEAGLDEVSGTIGGVRVEGRGAVKLLPLAGGHKPNGAVQIATGDLDLDSFLPQKRTAALDDSASIQPARYRVSSAISAGGPIIPIAARGGQVWSSASVDLSILNAFDGSFAVQSDSVRIGGITVANADLDAELQNGALKIRHLTGKTFGGDLTIDGGVVAEQQGGRFEARYALNGADMGAAGRVFDAKSSVNGSATFDGRLAGRGASIADIVGSLAGEGTLAVMGFNVAGDQNLAMMGLGGVAQAIEQVAGLRGRLQPIAVDVSGPYRVANGVVTFDELTFSSEIGEGSVKGTADLPEWRMAAAGEIRLGKAFVSGDAKAAKPIPFELNGALDAPRLKIDIAALPGGGLRIPIDKLRTKKGAKELLNGLLPNSAQKRETPTVAPLAPPVAKPTPPTAPVAPTSPSNAARPADAPTEPPKKADGVEDILKGILKGIGR